MTLPAWHPEIVVDATAARALVRSQFPDIAAKTVEPMGHGYDNTAFLFDERFVFRFPRRTVAAALIVREMAVLPSIAPLLPLAVPIPLLQGVAENEYPWPFAGYDRIDGSTAASLEVSEAEAAAWATPLADFLRSLHAIEPNASQREELPGDLIGRLDHTRCLPLATERLAELEAAGVVRDVEPFLDFLAENPPARCDRPRIVHGDLYARHLLVDAENRLCGAIDWGDVHLGDPALDLSVVLTMLPRDARSAFAHTYGEITPQTWVRATYRAIYHSVLVTYYGHSAADPEMLRIGLLALARLRAQDLG